MSIKKFAHNLYSLCKCVWYRTSFDCKFGRKTILKACILHGKNMVSNGVHLEQCDLGYGTFVGRNTSFYKTKIGSYCSIGEDVKLVFGNHPTHKLVSTHPAFYSAEGQYGFTYTSKNLVSEFDYNADGTLLNIGNDVWIGSYARIMSGLEIGDGAIIGAGAIVTKDVLPYTVMVGVPAKELYKRFSDEQIDKLLEVQWWNKGEAWIEDNIELFEDVERFLNGLNYEYKTEKNNKNN